MGGQMVFDLVDNFFFVGFVHQNVADMQAILIMSMLGVWIPGVSHLYSQLKNSYIKSILLPGGEV